MDSDFNRTACSLNAVQNSESKCETHLMRLIRQRKLQLETVGHRIIHLENGFMGWEVWGGQTVKQEHDKSSHIFPFVLKDSLLNTCSKNTSSDSEKAPNKLPFYMCYFKFCPLSTQSQPGHREAIILHLPICPKMDIEVSVKQPSLLKCPSRLTLLPSFNPQLSWAFSLSLFAKTPI